MALISGETDLQRIHSEKFFSQLVEGIQELLNHDIEKLIALLYRIDVSEEKIKSALSSSEAENTATQLAQLILDRMFLKIKTRSQTPDPGPDTTDEERW